MGGGEGPCPSLLLHGPTGTGKTECARLLASEIGATHYAARATDDDGGAPSAHQRLSSLKLAHCVLAGTRNLVLFDEMEDAFRRWSPGGALSQSLSKLWFNHSWS